MSLTNRSRVFRVQPVITAGAYASGDVVGGLIEIPMFDVVGKGGIIRHIYVVDEDGEEAPFTFHFYDERPSVIADNAPFAPTVDDSKVMVGAIPLLDTDYIGFTSHSWAISEPANVCLFQARKTIFCYAVVNSIATYTATDHLSFAFGFWGD